MSNPLLNLTNIWQFTGTADDVSQSVSIYDIARNSTVEVHATGSVSLFPGVESGIQSSESIELINFQLS